MIGARIGRAIGGGIFGTDAAGYHGARLDYPEALFDRLDAYAGGLHGASIFEVGAGTGIATRALGARGPARLTIIEPDPVLAARLGADGFETVNAAFESAETPFTAYDVGVAASSIHWVDPALAHRRARSLLRAGGTWAIWWNVYRAQGIGDAFADALLPRLAGLAMPPSEAADRHYSFEERAHRAALAESGFDGIEFHVWRRERMLSASEMRSLYDTFSFVRALPAGERLATLDSISDLVESEFAGSAPNVVLTPLYLARAR
ncbi:MAG: methyltransferase type 11 [Alphaproteobacteria bacterium]|nr:methyltransferase type 11 [Alphaproteobacteria bacterium]MDB5721978.1 methyltransferase type 11 [Alphaproteobacteria bacterium]